MTERSLVTRYRQLWKLSRVVLTQAPRQLPPYLIFNVGQKEYETEGAAGDTCHPPCGAFAVCHPRASVDLGHLERGCIRKGYLGSRDCCSMASHRLFTSGLRLATSSPNFKPRI